MAGCLQDWISIGFQRQVLPQVGVIKKESPVTPKRRGFFGQAERALYHPYQSLALSRVPSFGKTGPYVRCGLFVLACAPEDRSAKTAPRPTSQGNAELLHKMRNQSDSAETPIYLWVFAQALYTAFISLSILLFKFCELFGCINTWRSLWIAQPDSWTKVNSKNDRLAETTFLFIYILCNMFPDAFAYYKSQRSKDKMVTISYSILQSFARYWRLL